jgi:hypothetical protein
MSGAVPEDCRAAVASGELLGLHEIFEAIPEICLSIEQAGRGSPIAWAVGMSICVNPKSGPLRVAGS